MAMFGLIVHIVTLMSLRFEVRGEMTADLVFSLLSDRFDQLAIETYSLKSELRSSVAAINDRIDNIENISKSPLHSNTYSTDVQGNKMVKADNKNPNDRVLKALKAEKTYVRNVLTDYEKKLIEFQSAVSDQMNVMNTTIEASRDIMGRKLDVNTGIVSKSVHQLMTNTETKLIDFQSAVSDQMNVMNTTIEASREIMGRKLEENTDIISKSVHQLMTNAETKFQDVIKEFETTMNNTSIEHENIRSDIREIQNTVKDIEVHSKRVGFSAILKYHAYLIQSERVIVFGNVTHNHGGGYNESTGIFTAPRSGSYKFHLSVDAIINRGGVHLNIYVGKSRKVVLVLDYDPWTVTGSKTTVAYMSLGQQAYISGTPLKSYTSTVLGYGRSSFTGVLVN